MSTFRQTQKKHVIPVILLKTKSKPHDNYEDYFRSLDVDLDAAGAGIGDKSQPQPQPGPHSASASASATISFNPIFIPVLEHQRNEKALNSLGSLLNRGKLKDQYGGMIFTSQRAVEGWSDTVMRVEDENQNKTDDNVETKIEADTDIAIDTRTNQSFTTDVQSTTEFPVYVVGPATSRALNTLVTRLESIQNPSSVSTSSPLSSSSTTTTISTTHGARKRRSKFLQLNPKIQGEHTGNGANLAIYIQNHYNALQRQKYFMYYEAPRLPFIPLVGMGSENYSRKRLESSDPRLSKKPLLFLVGEQRRDIIPKTLMLVGDDDRDGNQDGNQKKDGVLPQSISTTTTTTTNNSTKDFERELTLKSEIRKEEEDKYIAVEEIEVYSTCVRKEFKTEFDSLVNGRFELDGDIDGTNEETKESEKQDSTPTPPSIIAIIIFSPQGTKEMLKSINFLDENDEPIRKNIDSRWDFGSTTTATTPTTTNIPTTSSPPNIQNQSKHQHQHQPKYILSTIGPTTKQHLITKYGIHPDVCADVPSPEGIGRGIVEFLTNF